MRRRRVFFSIKRNLDVGFRLIRIYYSKTFKNYLHKLSTCFLIGAIASLVMHRNDNLFYTKGLMIIQNANKKLETMKKIDYQEKWMKRYIARGEALLDNKPPIKKEIWNRKQFEKLRRKYVR